MKITKYIAIACAILSLASCDDWLGNKPKGYTIPETYADYEKLISSQYLINVLDPYLVYFTDDPMMVEKGETTVEWFEYIGKKDHERNIFSFQPGQVYTPGNSDAIWEDAYANIFSYNAIINNVLSATGGNDADKRRLQAEALVGRAFEYLCLINVYGKQYDASTAATDYGVPLVLSEEVGGGKYKRNTVAEVYEQIKEDLETAYASLADKKAFPFYPTKNACYSVLSRMYLYMGNYSEALRYANMILSDPQNIQLIEYKNYKKIDGTQWRNIVTDDDNETQFPDGQYGFPSPEQIYTRYISNHTFNSVAESDDLRQAFAKNTDTEAGEVDLREYLFFRSDCMNRGAGMEYFKGYTVYTAWIQINAGTSIPEMLLTAAECEARVGSTSKAIGYLNTLRASRIKNHIAYDAADYTDRQKTLQLVLDERRCEFAMIGYMRYVDLRRLNKEPQFAKTIVHKVGNETWELPANDPRYIMPVPQNVLEYNPDIPQYER
ncbi:RagB/SusD family nutrient uptake outer membrane protein [Bacteroides congonensis]|uniref:RagB/SusD family nutrient uptake outer membrane protein n=1 Tax=Bacteroides congonensis TaxID=1871006 RepID=UPI0025A3161F|nr:RagB/SusD family nutrient uptake outer membrane protein [Bacteroides congonensis]